MADTTIQIAETSPGDAAQSNDARRAMNDPACGTDPLPDPPPAKVLAGPKDELPIAGLGWMEMNV